VPAYPGCPGKEIVERVSGTGSGQPGCEHQHGCAQFVCLSSLAKLSRQQLGEVVIANYSLRES